MIRQVFDISYPCRNFGKLARRMLKDEKYVRVLIRARWRVMLLCKTLDYWPRIIGDNQRLKESPGVYFGITTWSLFSLYHFHIYALSVGGEMTYKIDGGMLIVEYRVNSGGMRTA